MNVEILSSSCSEIFEIETFYDTANDFLQLFTKYCIENNLDFIIIQLNKLYLKVGCVENDCNFFILFKKIFNPFGWIIKNANYNHNCTTNNSKTIYNLLKILIQDFSGTKMKPVKFF